MYSSFGRYSHAIVARVPDNFCDSPSSLARARQEHEQFTRLLRSLGLDVLELPADPQFPDSVFIEDTAFVVNGWLSLVIFFIYYIIITVFIRHRLNLSTWTIFSG